MRLLTPALILAILCLASRAEADQAADQYAVAAGHYAAGRWQLAVDEFQIFLNDFPEHERGPQATFFSGEALVQLGRFQDAQTRFGELLSRWPDSRFARQAMFRRAEAAYASGKHKIAGPLLEEFVEKFPDDDLNAYALPYLAEVTLEQGDAVAAEQLFDKALAAFPEGVLHDECRFGQAKAQEAMGHHDAARKAFRGFAGGESALAEQAQFQLGVLENAAGQYEAAVEALAPFNDRLKASPLHDKAQLGRGWALYKLARYTEAEKCLAALTTDAARPESASDEALYWLGVVRAADRRWPEAIESLEAVEAHDSDPTRVMQARAALSIGYARAGETEKSRAKYASFEHSVPSDELWSSTTWQVAEAAFPHDPAWAAERFEALTKESKSPEFVAKGLSGLAWCQFQSADAAGSASTFERLLAEHPDDPLAPEAALVRGQALERLGQADAALAMYELVIEKYPHSRQVAEALWKAARLEQSLGRLEPAVKHFAQLAEVRPPFDRYDALLYHWSRALSEQKQETEALVLLERLRRDWPQSPLAADASYRLAERALARKDYDQAASWVREATTAEPAPKILPHALYLAGRIALEREAWGDVRAPLERLEHEFPDHALVMAARYWIAEATYRQADYAEAVRQFALLENDVAGREDKWLAMVPLRHAQSLAQLNDWEQASAVATKIAHTWPDFDEQYEVDYVLGRALAAQAQFAEAREAYARVIRSPRGAKTETAAMAQWMIGETYFHQENYEQALAAYLRVEILYAWPKWQAGALLQAGKCQEVLGRWPDAVETYGRLIKTYPDTQFTDEAKRRLSVAQQRQDASRR